MTVQLCVCVEKIRMVLISMDENGFVTCAATYEIASHIELRLTDVTCQIFLLYYLVRPYW